eukprot:scaffold75316_cov61-Phaeocystis_antarctica.AAC.2
MLQPGVIARQIQGGAEASSLWALSDISNISEAWAGLSGSRSPRPGVLRLRPCTPTFPPARASGATGPSEPWLWLGWDCFWRAVALTRQHVVDAGLCDLAVR